MLDWLWRLSVCLWVSEWMCDNDVYIQIVELPKSKSLGRSNFLKWWYFFLISLIYLSYFSAWSEKFYLNSDNFSNNSGFDLLLEVSNTYSRILRVSILCLLISDSNSL